MPLTNTAIRNAKPGDKTIKLYIMNAEILKAIDGYEGFLVVGCALRLAPLVFVRPGELRKAEWVDIDFEKLEWRYMVTKTDTQHICTVIPTSSRNLEGDSTSNRIWALCFSGSA